MSQAQSTQNTDVKIGDGASPEVFTSIAEVISIDGPGGDRQLIDVTHLKSTAREKRAGLRDSGDLTLTMNRIVGDNGQDALIAAEAGDDPVNFRVIYPDGEQEDFAGIVTSFRESAAIDDVRKVTVGIAVTGTIARS